MNQVENRIHKTIKDTQEIKPIHTNLHTEAQNDAKPNMESISNGPSLRYKPILSLSDPGPS